MSTAFLFLKDSKQINFIQRAWILIKIFIKEGLYAWQWDLIWRLGKPFGSVRISNDLMQKLIDEGFQLNSRDDLAKGIQAVLVVRDVQNLRWALHEKAQGRVSRILAGPFIATMPFEYGSILRNPAIDGLIFLSRWHRDLFCKAAPEVMPRSHIWFAGVDCEKWVSSGQLLRDEILIYFKQGSEQDILDVQAELSSRNLKYSIIRYGDYSEDEYRKCLERAKFVIFIHRTETQGIASFEAWSMGRPTLHFNFGIMRFLGVDYFGASSCPYLNERLGEQFKTWQEFPAAFEKLNQHWQTMNPRAEVLSHFTWKHSIDNFKSIMKATGV